MQSHGQIIIWRFWVHNCLVIISFLLCHICDNYFHGSWKIYPIHTFSFTSVLIPLFGGKVFSFQRFKDHQYNNRNFFHDYNYDHIPCLQVWDDFGFTSRNHSQLIGLYWWFFFIKRSIINLITRIKTNSSIHNDKSHRHSFILYKFQYSSTT